MQYQTTRDFKNIIQKILLHLLSMPLQTRNIAKGVPPRAHPPKRTKSNSGQKISAKKATQSRKRADTESNDDTESNESEATTRKRVRLERRGNDEVKDLEAEVIDLDATPPPEDVSDDAGSPTEKEVSKIYSRHTESSETHLNTG